jgi:hypothetical protein
MQKIRLGAEARDLVHGRHQVSEGTGHPHEAPACVEIVFLDGTVIAAEEEAGMVIWRESREIHELSDRTGWESQNIQVGLKAGGHLEASPSRDT